MYICQSILAPGGRLANVGVHGKPVELHVEKLWDRNIAVTTRLVDTVTTPMLLKVVRSGKLQPSKLVTHRFTLDDVMKAYNTFGNAAKEGALKVILKNQRQGLSGSVQELPLTGTQSRSRSASDRLRTRTRAYERTHRLHSVADLATEAIPEVAAYDRRSLIADVIAGLTVGVVALPLAMAFGIASGVTPQAGIYTAIVGGFVVSLLGGSRIQIGGPTGAFVVIVAGIVAAHGLPGLLMVTMMAGVILLFLAVTGLGQAIKFIPRPVVLGFTNGIALLIASTQIKDFFGLGIGDAPGRFATHEVVRRVDEHVSSRRAGAGRRVAGTRATGPTLATADSRLHCGTCPGHGGGGGLSAAGRHDWFKVRGDSKRPSAD